MASRHSTVASSCLAMTVRNLSEFSFSHIPPSDKINVDRCDLETRNHLAQTTDGYENINELIAPRTADVDMLTKLGRIRPSSEIRGDSKPRN
jgi:hypothetical protein